MEEKKLLYKKIGNKYTGFLYIVWFADKEMPPIDWITEEQYLFIRREEKKEKRRKQR